MVTPNPSPQGDGWIELFNGRDLTGWREIGTLEGWSVKSGELVAEGKAQSARQAGWLMSEREFTDFELQLQFALGERADSGVAFRCDRGQTTGISQAEIQIVDQADSEFIATYDRLPFARTGALSGVTTKATLGTVERDTWHTMTVTCVGRHVTATVDGVVTVDANLDDYKDNAQAMGRAGMTRPTGPIGLQRLLGNVRYRNIRVREL
jgi:hypothetical protein